LVVPAEVLAEAAAVVAVVSAAVVSADFDPAQRYF